MTEIQPLDEQPARPRNGRRTVPLTWAMVALVIFGGFMVLGFIRVEVNDQRRQDDRIDTRLALCEQDNRRLAFDQATLDQDAKEAKERVDRGFLPTNPAVIPGYPEIAAVPALGPVKVFIDALISGVNSDSAERFEENQEDARIAIRKAQDFRRQFPQVDCEAFAHNVN